MCVNCIRSQVDITEGIQKQVMFRPIAQGGMSHTSFIVVLVKTYPCLWHMASTGDSAVVQGVWALPAAPQALAEG
jgi:hypothetical protein